MYLELQLRDAKRNALYGYDLLSHRVVQRTISQVEF